MSLKPAENRRFTAVNHPVNWAINRIIFASSFFTSHWMKIFLLLEKRQIWLEITLPYIFKCARAAGMSQIAYFRLVYEFKYLLKMAP